MTIKIKLLDSVIEAFRNSDRELFEEISDEEIRYGITAALEAMVEYGMARVVHRGIWSTELAPANQDVLIIRLSSDEGTDGGKK